MKITLSTIKADIGSIAGHIRPSEGVLKHVERFFFDSPSIVRFTTSHVKDGKLTEKADGFDHPFWDGIRKRVSIKTLNTKRQVFFHSENPLYRESKYGRIHRRNEEILRDGRVNLKGAATAPEKLGDHRRGFSPHEQSRRLRHMYCKTHRHTSGPPILNRTSKCFVSMPFRASLHFLFLYLQKHLTEKHGLCVERADHQIRPIPLVDKILGQIIEADILIGEITGANPNVLYEIGFAHALDKPVILLTQDSPNEAPSMLRHLEMIHYDIVRHEELFNKLDNAIQNVFGYWC